jgi:nitrate reductase alpha subunit
VFRLQEFKFNWYPQEPQLQKNKVKPLEFSIYISAAGFVPALILKLKDYNIKKKKKEEEEAEAAIIQRYVWRTNKILVQAWVGHKCWFRNFLLNDV